DLLWLSLPRPTPSSLLVPYTTLFRSTVATSAPPVRRAPEEAGFDGDEQPRAPKSAAATSDAANVLIDVAVRAATTRLCPFKSCPTGQKTARSKTRALPGFQADLRAEALWPPFSAHRSGQVSGHLTRYAAAARARAILAGKSHECNRLRRARQDASAVGSRLALLNCKSGGIFQWNSSTVP